jgi:predicted Zn-dependent protease
MKSSTIRRSNLSKEKMAVLEALSKYRHDGYDNSVGVYVRPNREKELDLLWQNFKVNQKSDKSPNIYLVSGFVAGAVVMLVLTVFISFAIRGVNTVQENTVAPVKKEKLSFSFIPSSQKATEETARNELYTVQDGDTMEAILVRFYGSYSKEKESLVLKTNNMTNPNKLSIGQQLTIPME